MIQWTVTHIVIAYEHFPDVTLPCGGVHYAPWLLIPRGLDQHTLQSRAYIQLGWGHYHRKVVRRSVAVMTLFFQASERSLAYQFTIIAPLRCHFKSSEKSCIFSLIFGQNFSSQDAKLLNFCAQDPSFFKKIRSLEGHTHKKKKKSWGVPPPPYTIGSGFKSMLGLPGVKGLIAAYNISAQP